MSLHKQIHKDPVHLEIPILQWIYGDRKGSAENIDKLDTLMRTYRKTNNLYDMRFEPKEKIIDELTQLLEDLEDYDISTEPKSIVAEKR